MLLDSGLWRGAANCRNTDLAGFFPVGTTGDALDQIAAAKTLCNDCTVQDMCLEFALTTNQDSGVWGGHSEEERRILRRGRALTKRRVQNQTPRNQTPRNSRATMSTRTTRTPN